jgi:hypothetical protein
MKHVGWSKENLKVDGLKPFFLNRGTGNLLSSRRRASHNLDLNDILNLSPQGGFEDHQKDDRQHNHADCDSK